MEIKKIGQNYTKVTKYFTALQFSLLKNAVCHLKWEWCVTKTCYNTTILWKWGNFLRNSRATSSSSRLKAAECPQTPTDLGWHLEGWEQLLARLLCQHWRFMGEKEVTARYLPSTQLVIGNAGGEGKQRNKETKRPSEMNAKLWRTTWHPRHPSPGGGELGKEAAYLEQDSGRSGGVGPRGAQGGPDDKTQGRTGEKGMG